jgi:hypothetical protein
MFEFSCILTDILCNTITQADVLRRNVLEVLTQSYVLEVKAILMAVP